MLNEADRKIEAFRLLAERMKAANEDADLTDAVALLAKPEIFSAVCGVLEERAQMIASSATTSPRPRWRGTTMNWTTFTGTYGATTSITGCGSAGNESREEAVRQLAGAVARKARIARGDHVCDIGCGYGATARMLAAEFGAHVTAMTISPAQHAYARGLARNAASPEYLCKGIG